MTDERQENGNISTLRDCFECPICLHIPRKSPIYQCNAGHMICSDCKGRVSNCPLCRKPITQRLYFVERMIENLPIYCKFETMGCSFEGAMKDVEKHEKTCDYGLIECSNTQFGCQEVMSRAKMKIHLCETCPYSPVECPVASCGIIIGNKLLKGHFKRVHEKAYSNETPEPQRVGLIDREHVLVAIVLTILCTFLYIDFNWGKYFPQLW